MGFRRDRVPRADSHRSGVFLVSLLVASACAPPAEEAVVDGIGRRVVLPSRIERVVTLAPNVTELVAAAGGIDRLVGVDSESDFPPAVRDLPKVGQLQPNLEAIVSLQPDLVLASTSGNPASIAAPLEALGIPLYVVRTDRLRDIPQAVRALSSILGTEPEAQLRELEEMLARPAPSPSKRPRVLMMLWPEPLYVAGRNTFVDDLIVMAGGENAVEVEGWPAYSLEALMISPPDVILYPKDAVAPETIARLPLEKRVWGSLAAVREGRVVAVRDDLVMRPGPRVVEGVEEIAEAIR